MKKFIKFLMILLDTDTRLCYYILVRNKTTKLKGDQNNGKRHVCETEIFNEIIACFKRTYGFAPAKKQITLLESSGYAAFTRRQKEVEFYNWVAFCVGGIGYEYSADFLRIERNNAYDM